MSRSKSKRVPPAFGLQPARSQRRGDRTPHARRCCRERAGGSGACHWPVLGPRLQYRKPDSGRGRSRGHRSRITIVTSGTPHIIEQIKAQLGRIVSVHEVHDLTVEGASVERELGLFKVEGTGDKRIEALRLARNLSRQCGGQHAVELCLRGHRHAREDRRLRRTDAPAGPVGTGPHRVAALARGAI